MLTIPCGARCIEQFTRLALEQEREPDQQYRIFMDLEDGRLHALDLAGGRF
jgi:hypothetical protein